MTDEEQFHWTLANTTTAEGIEALASPTFEKVSVAAEWKDWPRLKKYADQLARVAERGATIADAPEDVPVIERLEDDEDGNDPE